MRRTSILAPLLTLPLVPELSTTTRLADRRSLVVGDRFYAMGAEDGSYPATGFHTRGEMGVWTLPIKLLEGIWFRAHGTWPTAERYTNGWGHTAMALGTHRGVRITGDRLLQRSVRQSGTWRLTVGAMLPRGADAESVRLDGRRVQHRGVSTARGRQELVYAGSARGATRLTVRLR